MVATAPAIGDYRKVQFHPYGHARDFLACRDRECLIEGAAGTGKSFNCLAKLHAVMLKYPKARALMVRKTAVSLAASVLDTYEKKVLTTGRYGVTFFGGSRREPGQYRYPNGSRIVVGGMDNPAKIMSSEFDICFANEATDLTEEDWESLTTRLRHGVMPYQQIIADCNPQAPSHWLNQRALRGVVTRFGSRHEDNPTLWDHARGEWTERGTAYMEVLERLTGVRYQRLRLGQWVAAEGQVYDQWREDVHVTDRPIAEILQGARCLGAADWGFANPGSLHVWAVDGDGRVTLVAEEYRTKKTIDWWIDRARELQAQFSVSQWVCDPSEPSYIEQFRQAGLHATSAYNAIAPGISAMQQRLEVAGDGRPRLQVHRDALRERDELLVEAKQPWCLVQEIPEYVWAKNVGGVTLKDKPVDAYNHGLDCARYLCAELDVRGLRDIEAPQPVSGDTLFSLSGADGFGDDRRWGDDPWSAR